MPKMALVEQETDADGQPVASSTAYRFLRGTAFGNVWVGWGRALLSIGEAEAGRAVVTAQC
jgi:hypothetical protein